MSKHSTQFEATPGGMVLTNAILLYKTEVRRGASTHGAPGQQGGASPAFTMSSTTMRRVHGLLPGHH